MSDTAKETVIRFLQSSEEPIRAALLIRATGLMSRDLVVLESQGVILAERKHDGGPGRPVCLYRLPCGPLDPVAVRAYTVSKGLCEPGNSAPVSPPEFRAYESHLQHQEGLARAQKARDAKEAAAIRRRQHRDIVESWPSRKVPRVRAWAEKQGLDVGTRGRLPKWVVDKYDQEVDDQAELQALLRRTGGVSAES
ncbi:histone-like nucleoid-structuring protein Lsr2 [Streptomyces violascens]|uniref:Lsr2 family DNA-binding protein n=1 Tax=Streptomyces violascens TaxID=67381 RepID=UPI0037B8FCAF